MAIQPRIDPDSLVLNRFGHSEDNSFGELSSLSNVPKSTIFYRAKGRPSIQQKAISQQYLTPPEEQALANYFIRISNRGFPLPVYFARDLAHIIILHRDSV